MEASAIQAPAGLARNRISLGTSLLRLRSDEQLVALFRQGHEEAFAAIHDRYKQRLFAYTRQMLSGSRPDAEDALQDIFVRAYAGLRASDRELSLRAWLYRIAHNRCIDELRRPLPPAPEVLGILRSPVHDPTVEAEQRESLRRLIDDVRRLPDQQRSALLMRELAGMSYADVAAAIAVSVPAVKSLLVRARVGLAQAAEARDTACVEIQEDLVLAHDRGVRPSGLARRHMHDCAGCRAFRSQMRGTSRQLAALAPTLGPLGVLAKLLGFGGGATGGAAVAGSGAGAAGTGAAASAGVLAGGVGHVTALLAAAVVTAGGAVELQHAIAVGASHRSHHQVPHVATADVAATAAAPAPSSTGSTGTPATYTGTAKTPALSTAPDRDLATSSTKSKLPTTGPTSPSQQSSGGAANVGALSSGGAGTTPGGVPTGSGSGTGTGTPGDATSTGTGSPPSGTGTGTPGGGTGTGSSSTGSGSGTGSTTSSTGTSGSSGSTSSTTGSSQSTPSGSSSGTGTPTQPAPGNVNRLGL